MLNKNAIGITSVIVIMALLLITAAQAQPFGPRDSAAGKGIGSRFGDVDLNSLRIVKGTVDRVSDDYVLVDVESIFVPREGPMEKVPDTVKIALADRGRFFRAGNRNASLADFSKGDIVVAITTYRLEDGYSLRALFDSESAQRLRQMIGQRLGARGGPGMMGRGGERRGMMGRQQGAEQGMRDRLAQRGMGPMFFGTYEGLTDNGEAVRLELKGMMGRAGAGRGMGDRERMRGMQRRGDRDQGGYIRKFPEPREVVVRIADRTRYFADGEKGALNDFDRGDGVVVMLRGRTRGGDGAYLVLMADRESAEKLRNLMKRRMMQGQAPQRDWDSSDRERRGRF